MESCSVFSPAKLNFFLAVTGRRADGFHDLVSVAAPLELGDTVRLEPGKGSRDTVECGMPGVPEDGTNLVLRAVSAWREAGGVAPPVHIVLDKQIPPASGLGGGSSNAVAALKGLERIAPGPIGAGAVLRIAGAIGSDCPLFLADGPVLMRGRGERIETLGAAAAQRLSARELLLFRPGFGVDTAWAFSQLAGRAPDSYLSAGDAGARVAEWLGGCGANEALSFNSFEGIVFSKFVALPALGQRLKERLGIAPRLSGSGSACYAWLTPAADWSKVQSEVRDALGQTAHVFRTRVAASCGGYSG